MEILNLICYACATVFAGVVFIAVLATFFLSIYACFTKKIQGSLLTKLFVVFVLGCVSSWLLKFIVFLASKLFV